MTLGDIVKHLESENYQMKNPGLTTIVNGHNKTLYMSTIPSIHEKTKDNLQKTLLELGLIDGQEILVADVTSPSTIILKLKYRDEEMAVN